MSTNISEEPSSEDKDLPVASSERKKEKSRKEKRSKKSKSADKESKTDMNGTPDTETAKTALDAITSTVADKEENHKEQEQEAAPSIDDIVQSQATAFFEALEKQAEEEKQKQENNQAAEMQEVELREPRQRRMSITQRASRKLKDFWAKNKNAKSVEDIPDDSVGDDKKGDKKNSKAKPDQVELVVKIDAALLSKFKAQLQKKDETMEAVITRWVTEYTK